MVQQARSWAYHKQFRYYTRQVKLRPADSHYHQRRLQIASNAHQSEALQGAMADYFLGCWHELAENGARVLEEFGQELPTHITPLFWQFIRTGHYLTSISVLATRFSVLVSPSMNVPNHHLYISKDDARLLSKQISEQILQSDDTALVQRLQDDYFKHCLACQDRMGFMMTWFHLAKAGFEFDEAWINCKALLEN